MSDHVAAWLDKVYGKSTPGSGPQPGSRRMLVLVRCLGLEGVTFYPPRATVGGEAGAEDEKRAWGVRIVDLCLADGDTGDWWPWGIQANPSLKEKTIAKDWCPWRVYVMNPGPVGVKNLYSVGTPEGKVVDSCLVGEATLEDWYRGRGRGLLVSRNVSGQEGVYMQPGWGGLIHLNIRLSSPQLVWMLSVNGIDVAPLVYLWNRQKSKGSDMAISKTPTLPWRYDQEA
ncbi:MAG: hypothetical protein M1840_002378 [Geoglossum simile]|nr:MAG: hypothetical protein M1840_002378 [Geoglossum simile]